MIALPIKQESICSFAHFDLSCIFVYLLIILHRQIDSSKKTGSPSWITGLHRHRSMIRCDVFSFSASRLQLRQTRSVPLQLSAVLKLPLCQNLFPIQVCLHLDPADQQVFPDSSAERSVPRSVSSLRHRPDPALQSHRPSLPLLPSGPVQTHPLSLWCTAMYLLSSRRQWPVPMRSYRCLRYPAGR